MTEFWIICVLVIALPVGLFVMDSIFNSIRYNRPHITAILLVSIAWLVFNYRELTCFTRECIEWKVSANGGALVIQELFPATVLILTIPWSLVVFKNIRNQG